MPAVRATLLPAVILVALCACSTSAPAPDAPGRDDLRPVSLPDLSGADLSVANQVRDRHAALGARLRSESGDAQLGAAYGALGMVLQAAEYYDAAEPALRNARTLAPDEIRWPYYLGHLYQTRGELAAAEDAFADALAVRPDDLATLIWLGRVLLDAGKLGEARETFTRASRVAPDVLAVLAGLGRVELAERDYATAATRFERALEVDPDAAESLHAPLAVAYRALGEAERAERHERLWANRDILVPDPLNQELEMILDNGLSNELRGVRALELEDWETAAYYFRRGMQVTPGNTALRRSLQHKLGTALFLGGDVPAATVEFEQVVSAAPGSGLDESTAKAHYSLGVIDMAEDRPQRAIAHFEGAVTHQPDYQEARLALAEVLWRSGRAEEALPHYERALQADPGLAQATFGYSLALIRAGQSRRARAELEQALGTHPDEPAFAHMLARLLVSAPDGSVRDGTRAMQIMQVLLQGTRTTELGETLAMVRAELGDFQGAADVQRQVLAVVGQNGADALTRQMERNLALYEKGQPVRSFSGEPAFAQSAAPAPAAAPAP
jgi:tetratricopeptide (TPR) repeat protein